MCALGMHLSCHTHPSRPYNRPRPEQLQLSHLSNRPNNYYYSCATTNITTTNPLLLPLLLVLLLRSLPLHYCYRSYQIHFNRPNILAPRQSFALYKH